MTNHRKGISSHQLARALGVTQKTAWFVLARLRKAAESAGDNSGPIDGQAQLSRWLNNGFSNGGVGVLTRNIPAIDLNILDPAIVQQLADWCETYIGKTVQRVGRAPKRLLVYRTNEPFAKMASKKYVDSSGQTHQIEILGDGQQFVAYGTHPETGKSYEWISEHGL